MSQIKSVASLESSLQAMKGQAEALKEELGTELQSQLTVEDQRQVDVLNDLIGKLTQENRGAWQERIKVSVLIIAVSVFIIAMHCFYGCSFFFFFLHNYVTLDLG